MSDFTRLKQQRKTKEIKSHVLTNPALEVGKKDSESGTSTASTDRDEPQSASASGPLLYDTKELYAALPPTLEVRIDDSDGGNGRGLYSHYHRKPGEHFLLEADWQQAHRL